MEGFVTRARTLSERLASMSGADTLASSAYGREWRCDAPAPVAWNPLRSSGVGGLNVNEMVMDAYGLMLPSAGTTVTAPSSTSQSAGVASDCGGGAAASSSPSPPACATAVNAASSRAISSVVWRSTWVLMKYGSGCGPLFVSVAVMVFSSPCMSVPKSSDDAVPATPPPGRMSASRWSTTCADTSTTRDGRPATLRRHSLRKGPRAGEEVG